MREIMEELKENIKWPIVIITMLACSGVVLTIIMLCALIISMNAWWLLLAIPAIVCISLAIGIYPY